MPNGDGKFTYNNFYIHSVSLKYTKYIIERRQIGNQKEKSRNIIKWYGIYVCATVRNNNIIYIYCYIGIIKYLSFIVNVN